jgi:hypothetical protein
MASTDNTRRPRSDPAERDSVILQAAIDEALAYGYQWITRNGVAERARMAPSTVSLFGSMVDLKRAVLHAAVAREILPIVRQGLGDGHAIVMAAPVGLRQRAMGSVTV